MARIMYVVAYDGEPDMRYRNEVAEDCIVDLVMEGEGLMQREFAAWIDRDWRRRRWFIEDILGKGEGVVCDYAKRFAGDMRGCRHFADPLTGRAIDIIPVVWDEDAEEWKVMEAGA